VDQNDNLSAVGSEGVQVLADMRLKVVAIQVDGGSGFRAEFEDACKAAASSANCPRKPQAQRRRQALQRRMAIQFLRLP
jgi:hypothetical protein